MSTTTKPGRSGSTRILRTILLVLVLVLVLLLCLWVSLPYVWPIIRPPAPGPTPTGTPATAIPTTTQPTPTSAGATATNTPVVVPETPTPAATAETATPAPTVPTTPKPTSTVAATPTVSFTIGIRNVLRNGGFEEGFQPNQLAKYWNGFDNGAAAFSFHIDDWPLVVIEGKFSQMMEIKNATEPDRFLGIYQTAPVISGKPYTFTVRGMVRTNTGNIQETSFGYRMQVGFDLKGGQDWQAVQDWVELPWDEQLRLQDSFRFETYTTTLTANSDKLTVFIRAWKKWGDAGEGDYNVDDVSLVGLALVTPAAPPIPSTGGAGILATVWDNVRVWGTVALLLLLLGGAAWQARRRVS
jgi:hypothetical protein